MLTVRCRYEERANLAVVPHLRRCDAELVAEALREVAVAREAELERERGQVVAVGREPLQSRPEPGRLPEPVQAEPGFGTEDAGEVERRRVQPARDLVQRGGRVRSRELCLGRLDERAVPAGPRGPQSGAEGAQDDPRRRLLGAQALG